MSRELEDRIARLERELADLRRHRTSRVERTVDDEPGELERTPSTITGGRRQILKLAGLTAAGATAAVVARPTLAAAADNDPVLQGVVNNATNTTQLVASDDSALFLSGAAFGLEADGGAANALFSATGGTPTSDLPKGSLYVDATGTWWAKVADGSAGWRQLAGPTAAGSFHAITPARVYDSRKSMSPMASGVIATGAARTISVADRRNVDTGAVVAAGVVPAGATAVAFNLTITGTSGGGFIAINPGTSSTVNASFANWAAAGTVVANAGVSGIDGSRRLTLIVGGAPGASTHAIVDITGYYA